MAAKKINDCFNTVKPVRDAMEVINGKWRLAIIISIGAGNERFSDIEESILGITPKALTKELKILETNKLIKREMSESTPVKITYSLEPYADTLAPIIYSLKDWGINHEKMISNNSIKVL
jgi:DNA-binding HxlR family transcriptional regulator